MQKDDTKDLFKINDKTNPAQVATLLTNGEINLPDTPFKFDKGQFINLLLSIISLTSREKIALMLQLPYLSRDKVEKLILIFQKEKQQLLDIHKGKQDKIDELKEKSFAEIKELIVQVKNSNSLGILRAETVEEKKY